MKNYLKGFKNFGLNESFGWGGLTGGMTAASRMARSRRNDDYNSPRRHASRMEDMDMEMEKPEITTAKPATQICNTNFGEKARNSYNLLIYK